MATVLEIIEETLKINPAREHELVYNSSSETLEPLYFWILDFMNDSFEGKVEKLVDNFVSSPGSGHFLEQSQRKSFLQDTVIKNFGTINQIMRTIVNLVYDLKDFEIRLKHYEATNSNKKEVKEAGLLALKQIWIDNVDIKRGVGSINQLTSGNLNFVTLRDAFMVAKSLKDVDKLDLNDRVKRILKPRISEFFEWKKLSYEELKKRYSIEKSYLKSQVNTLHLYSRWVKPYLKSATDLEMKDIRSPEIVNMFNTTIFELTLMGKKEFNVDKAIQETTLPKGISKPKRKYYSIVIVNFHFRGIPHKTGQHFMFGGKANVKFKAYAMNENELKVLEQEMEKSDLNDVMKLLKGTTEGLDELKNDIDYFLNENKDEKKVDEKKDTNPFSALFSIFMKKNDESSLEIKRVKKDSYSEKLIRELAKEVSSEECFNIFDTYKKSNGMPSYDSPFYQNAWANPKGYTK